MNSRSVAAEAAVEAQRLYDGDTIVDENTGESVSHDDWGYAECQRQAFVAGAAWAGGRGARGDDARELADHLNGLMDSLDDSVSHEQVYEQLQVAWNMARALRTHGTTADAKAERAAILADLREWSRPLGQSPAEDTLRLVIARIEARS